MRYLTILIPILLVSPAVALADFNTTFEDLDLQPNTFLNDAGTSGGFTVDGHFFNNYYDSDYGFWSGWSISNTADTTTPGHFNQSSAIPGHGADGSSTYAVAYTFGYPTADIFHPSDSWINLAEGTSPVSIQVTNTTYAYLSMAQGDQFAHKFDTGDFLLLDIRGYDGLDGTGSLLGTLDFYLANFLDSDRYIVETWETLDLSPLAGARSLVFGLRSSDNDPEYGVNTPTYFAVDNFRTEVAAVPEPGSFLLMAVGLVGLIGFGRRRRRASGLLAGLLLLVVSTAEVCAEFDPQVGLPGSLGIPRESSEFTQWASSVISFDPGPQDISNPNSPLASAGDPLSILGPNTGPTVVSLGDGGSITLGFDRPIVNGPGADFAVFENGFLSGPTGSGLAYLELAFVEVSSDGENFFRFPSVSLTQTETQVGGFGLLDARDIHNLAGKHIAGFGTGFDLDDLVGISPLLDVNHVTQVRIIDVVGSIDPAFGSYDSRGNLINDPFKTPFASGGFDLGGVGVIHSAAVPEPSSLLLGATGLAIWGLVSRRRRARQQGHLSPKD